MAEKINLNVYGRLQFCETLCDTEKGKKREAVLLIPKKSAAVKGCAGIAEVKEALLKAAVAKFGEKVPARSIKFGLKDGDEQFHSETGEPYAGYEGCWALSVSTYFDFAMAKKSQGKVSYVPQEQLSDHFYAGAYVIANITLEGKTFTDDNGMTVKYVARYLQTLLFAKHGESLGGGRVNPEDAFGDVPDFDDEANDETNYGGNEEGDDPFA